MTKTTKTAKTKTAKTKTRAAVALFPAVKTAVAAKWRARSEQLVAQTPKASAPKTAKTAKTVHAHKARTASSAPACTKCGRVNTHGGDCRTTSACKARVKAAKTSGRAARG